MSNTDLVVNIVLPIAVVGGGSYALNRLGLPYILGVPLTIFIGIEEALRQVSGNKETPYEWYVERIILRGQL
jgi:hypothetical protein